MTSPNRSAGETSRGPRNRVDRVLNTYFRTADSPSLDDIRPTLWTGGDKAAWKDGDAASRSTLIE